MTEHATLGVAHGANNAFKFEHHTNKLEVRDTFDDSKYRAFSYYIQSHV